MISPDRRNPERRQRETRLFLTSNRSTQKLYIRLSSVGQNEEYLTGLALDGRGGLFAVGFTKSKDFPTVHPIQGSLRGVSDLFLTRFGISSLTPTFSTFFGGSGDDSGWGRDCGSERQSDCRRHYGLEGPPDQPGRLPTHQRRGAGRVLGKV